MTLTRRNPPSRPHKLPRRVAVVQALEKRTLFNSVAHFDTTDGGFDVELFDSLKPLSVENFIKVVSANLYVSTLIHRVANLSGAPAPKQILQGGGYRAATGLPEIRDPFPRVPDELNTNGLISNVRGTVAYAKNGPNTASTQYFANLTDNSSDLDSPVNAGGFTVFGQITPDTLATIDTIAALPTTNLDPGGDPNTNPFTDVPLNNNNAVVVISATFTQLDLKLGAGGAKSISFVDTDGTKSSMSLSGGGSATLHFVGTSMRRLDKHGSYTIAGTVSAIDDLSVTGSTAKSKVSISGKKGNGTFTMGGISTNGPLKSLSFAGVSLGGPITIGGDLGSLSATGGLNVNVSATSIGKASIKGDMTGVTFTLAAGLGKTSVSGSIVNSTINAATLISSVSAKSLSGAQIYAGMNLPGGGVPSGIGDFTNQGASIGSVSAKTTSNSNIAAFTLGKIALGSVTLNNGGTPFGLGAHTIASFSGTAVPGGKFSFKKISDPVVFQQALLAKGIDLIDARVILV